MAEAGMRFLDFVGGPGCKTWKVGQVQPADGGARLWWIYRIHERLRDEMSILCWSITSR